MKSFNNDEFFANFLDWENFLFETELISKIDDNLRVVTKGFESDHFGKFWDTKIFIGDKVLVSRKHFHFIPMLMFHEKSYRYYSKRLREDNKGE